MNITFCITTFNRLELLSRCINSILNLSFQKCIIISDNASVDGTESYCEELVKEYDFIYYYRNLVNLGSINNFINVLEKVTTEYLVVTADDDYFLSDEYSIFYNHISNLNSDLYVAKSFRIGSDNIKKASLPQLNYENGYYGSNLAENIIIADLFMWSACVFSTNLISKAIKNLDLKNEASPYRDAIDVSILYYLTSLNGFYFVNEYIHVFFDHLSQSSKPFEDLSFKKLFLSRVSAFDLLKTEKVYFYRNIYLVDLLLKAKVKNLPISYKYFEALIDFSTLNLKMRFKYWIIININSKNLKLIFNRFK